MNTTTLVLNYINNRHTREDQRFFILSQLERSLLTLWTALPKTVLELRLGSVARRLRIELLISGNDSLKDTESFLELMRSNLEEYHWSIVPTQAFQASNVLAVRRKTVSIPLEVGQFGDSFSDVSLWCPGNFVSINANWKGVIAHLQRLGQDTMLSVRFQPTVISSEEHEFLARSLSCCQQVLRKDDAVLAARAKVWFQHLENWAGGLQRGVALVSIILASNQTISPMTAQLIGSMFASGERKDLALYSGFEIQALEPDEESLICTKLHDAQALPAITVFVPEAPVDAGRLPYLLDSTEAASVFLLPPITLEAIPGLEYRHHLELDVQSSFSTPTSGEDKSVQLGMNRVGHKTQTVYLSKTDLRRHQYVIGQTGTGKKIGRAHV